jgi:hypothetical protein
MGRWARRFIQRVNYLMAIATAIEPNLATIAPMFAGIAPGLQ